MPLLGLIASPWTWLAVVAVFAAGVYTGGKFVSNGHEAALLTQERAFHDAYVAEVGKHRAIAGTIAKELNDAAVARQEDAVAFRAALASVRSSGKPLAVCPKAEPAPSAPLAAVAAAVGDLRPVARLPPGEPRLTAEFRRLFNAGTTIGMPGARNTEQPDDAAATAGSVAPEEVLEVNAENGEICNALRVQVLGFQRLVKQHGWWKQ
jgi:hypothetical protein